jgi:LPXTG-site transpeptidase (sortase) family protein
MIRFPRFVAAGIGQRRGRVNTTSLTARSRVLWTVGNLFMLLGIVVLLYVGGLYATDEYGRYAARGDSDVPPPVVVEENESAEPAPFTAPAPFVAPALNGQSHFTQQANVPAERVAMVSRLVIPSIKLDSKVVEVGWEIEDQGGAQVPVWQVAKYAVGQHHGSANPGDGENVVLAGHVGGYGHVFRDLFYVRPGDEVMLFSAGQEYMYTVKERLIVTEDGAPPEQRAENASLIGPLGQEMVTMVTCWPPTGKDKFTQRVVIRAVPFTASASEPEQSSWTIR